MQKEYLLLGKIFIAVNDQRIKPSGHTERYSVF